VTLKEAQLRQRAFDSSYWEINADDFQKLRHVTFHLTIALGKLGRYCERTEHGEAADRRSITDEVTPDLLIYSLQLANLFSLSLSDAYESRLRSNTQKSLNRGVHDLGETGNAT
jgi:hypothetical protein